MRKLIFAALLLLVPPCWNAGCGPSWDEVVRYPDGTYKDIRTGECFKDTSEGLVPVQCPPKEK